MSQCIVKHSIPDTVPPVDENIRGKRGGKEWTHFVMYVASSLQKMAEDKTRRAPFIHLVIRHRSHSATSLSVTLDIHTDLLKNTNATVYCRIKY